MLRAKAADIKKRCSRTFEDFSNALIDENVYQIQMDKPDNFYGDVETLLELIYFHYTEYNPVGAPKIVFELCSAYEWQAYMEGIKLGAKLVIDLIREWYMPTQQP